MSRAKREGSVGARRVKEGRERRSKRRSEVEMALAKSEWPLARRRVRRASRSLVEIEVTVVVEKRRKVKRVRRVGILIAIEA